mmetsp:Transcript_12993/g.45092  ORF Transcript_12993/g.45092 Transcript_12993/m.45092 type:complete len:208 (+) Transcript_12993:154-777(+)
MVDNSAVEVSKWKGSLQNLLCQQEGHQQSPVIPIDDVVFTVSAANPKLCHSQACTREFPRLGRRDNGLRARIMSTGPSVDWLRTFFVNAVAHFPYRVMVTQCVNSSTTALNSSVRFSKPVRTQCFRLHPSPLCNSSHDQSLKFVFELGGCGLTLALCEKQSWLCVSFSKPYSTWNQPKGQHLFEHIVFAGYIDLNQMVTLSVELSSI